MPIPERVIRRYPTCTRDAPRGKSFWWDGSAWQAGGGGWRWTFFGTRNERTTFEDEPGFASPSTLGLLLGRGYAADGIGRHSFPIYWGGYGRRGHFEFRTFVKDAATKTTVRQLTWGMLIDNASPTSRSHYFYL